MADNYLRSNRAGSIWAELCPSPFTIKESKSGFSLAWTVELQSKIPSLTSTFRPESGQLD